MDQCLFQNVEWFSMQNIELSFDPINVDVHEKFNVGMDTSSNDRLSCFNNFPASICGSEHMALQTFEETATQSDSTPSSPDDQGTFLNEKRIRNNEASKKFRKARKSRHDQLHIMEEIMMKENYFLKNQVTALEKEIEKWKEFFDSRQ